MADPCQALSHTQVVVGIEMTCQNVVTPFLSAFEISVVTRPFEQTQEENRAARRPHHQTRLACRVSGQQVVGRSHRSFHGLRLVRRLRQTQLGEPGSRATP